MPRSAAEVLRPGIVPLRLAGLRLPSLISIRVRLAQNAAPADDKAAALSHLFERKPGHSQVRLRLENPRDFSLILDLDAKVRPDREFQAEVERICGPESFEVLLPAPQKTPPKNR